MVDSQHQQQYEEESQSLSNPWKNRLRKRVRDDPKQGNHQFCSKPVIPKGKLNFSDGSNTSILDLPLSILEKIFSRLPIKAVLACKSVCASWYKLISDPMFSRSYLAAPPSVCLFISEFGDRPLFEINGNLGNSDEPVALRRRLNIPDEHRGGLMVVGCCNGLVCLLQGHQFEKFEHSLFVSNPVYGQTVRIPEPGKKNLRTFHYGFGYSSGLFKIVRIANKKHRLQPVRVEVEIYTVGEDDTWRNAGEAPYCVSWKFCPVNLNESLHWFGDKYSYTEDLHICSFHLGDEKPGELQPPPNLSKKINVELGVLSERLCVFQDNPSEAHFDIWSMKVYGVAESWTRERILKSWVQPQKNCGGGLKTSGDYRPVAVGGEDGCVLIVYQRNAILEYDPKRNKSTEIKVLKEKQGFEPFVYVPNFSSLKVSIGTKLPLLSPTFRL